MKEADDVSYLMMKVALIIAVFGAYRREVLTFMRIQDCATFIKINIRNTKTKVSRLFTIFLGRF